MENATDALYLAFGVLIFVLALSVTMSSFSMVRVAATSIIESKDRENDYTYVKYTNENGNLETSRIVGKETIIPTINRLFTEDYVVRFYQGSMNDPIYLYRINGVPTNEINKDDLRKHNFN